MAAPRERLIHVLTRIRDLGERSLFFVESRPAYGEHAAPAAVDVPDPRDGPDEPRASRAAVVDVVDACDQPEASRAGRDAVPAAGREGGGRSGGGVGADRRADVAGAVSAAGAEAAADPIGARWRDAEARVRGCTRCRLCETRTHAVFGSGTRHTRLFVIGEGPGQQEDLRAEAFVGPAGQLLTKILNAVGFGRDEVFITNVVKCRPPGNRAPLPDEVQACSGFLEEQLELVRPAAILLLGASAARAVLKTTAPIGALRRVVHRLGDVPVLVTYHPAALLRNPEYKRPTWEDVQLLRRVHDERVAAGA
jgi:DNA polymerase